MHHESASQAVTQKDAHGQSPRVLHCEENIVYQILTPPHRDAAAIVIARAFCMEPLGSSLPWTPTLSYYLNGIDHWIDHCATNGASVIAIDTAQHRIAGVCINRDRQWKQVATSPEYEAWYKNPNRQTYPISVILNDVCKQAENAAPVLQNESLGVCMDLYVLAVHPDYRGKGIACSMARICEPLVKELGFRCHTIGATSIFSARVGTKLGFSKLVEVDARGYEVDGKKVFENVKEPHGLVTYWIKEF
jgi:GNAT superfamily N-acetyltransferase